MKYPFIIIWCILCSFYIAFEYLIFLLYNLFALCWEFNLKYVKSWSYWSVCHNYHLGHFTDINIFETYERYVRFDSPKHRCTEKGELIKN